MKSRDFDPILSVESVAIVSVSPLYEPVGPPEAPVTPVPSIVGGAGAENGSNPRRTAHVGAQNGAQPVTPPDGSYANPAMVVDEDLEEPPRRNGHMNKVRILRESIGSPRGRIASLGFLLEIFKEYDIESLYKLYTLRIYQSLVISLMFTLTVFGVIMILLLNILIQTSSIVGPNVILAITTGLSLAGLVCVCIRKIYYHITHVVAIFVWVYMLGLVYLFIVYFPTSAHGTLDYIPMVVYTIFVIHCMVPINLWLGLCVGLLTGVISITVMAVMAGTDRPLYLSRLIGANLLLYLCANMVGAYNKYITDIAHRMFFLETRNYIEAKVKYGGRTKRQKILKEQLLTKVMPQYLVENVKRTLNQQKNNLRYLETMEERFHPLFVESHSDVSILYADIVRFTPLAASLKPSELVFALNQLFGRFDQLAQEHDCLRIKILGDCYYCVSGLPTPTDDHAINCVRMGQRMIQVIRQIRNETGIESLDMRIGVHTGNVLCGLIGLVKWQFDIWSNSVTIANHMESSGIPGKVHVTSATVKHLGDQFLMEPGNGAERDDLIRENNLSTFLIDAPSELDAEARAKSPSPRHPLSPAGRHGRRITVVECMEQWDACPIFQDLQHALRGSVDETSLINERLSCFLSGDDVNCEASPGSSTIRIDYSSDEMHPVLLTFRDRTLEWDYMRQVDDWLPWSLMVSALCFVLIFGVQLLMIKSTVSVYAVFVLGFFALLIIGAVVLSKKHEEFKSGASVWEGSASVNSGYWFGRIIAISLTLLVTITMSFVAVEDCEPWTSETLSTVTVVTFNDTYVDQLEEAGVCIHSAYFLYSLMLSMMTCTLFLRLALMAKLTVMMLEILLFCILFFGPYKYIFAAFDTLVGAEVFLHIKVRGPIYFLMLFFTLMSLCWRVEKDLRLSYLWRMKTAKERELAQRHEHLNNILLENILPRHVADYFLNMNRKPDDVYNRQYTNVAVMFASIADFFYEETMVNKNGIECIRPLNEIVIAFDKLALLADYINVEKIKMINTTYMAAAGLASGDERPADDNVVELARFAFAMMETLDSLSNDFLTKYELRIGLCHGEVIAGVVGAQKPQYDIWGDTVNVASRMESHGCKGKVQVARKTYKILKKHGFACTKRGRIEVKGKGQMTLYWVTRNVITINQTMANNGQL